VSTAFPHDVAAVGYVMNSGSQRDMAVYKLAGTTGDVRWSVSDLAGDAPGGHDQAWAVALSGEDVIVAGVTENSVTSLDFTVIKLSDSGNGSEDWRYRLPSGTAYSVAVDASGDVIAGGTAYNSLTSSHDFTVVKINGSTGGQIWRTQIDGSANGPEEAFAVAVDGNENVIAAGTTQNTGTAFDFTVVKLSGATGDEMWPAPKKINGTATGSWDAARAIALLPVAGEPDDVIAAGYTENSGTDADFTVYRLSGSNGATVWPKKIDGTATDEGAEGDIAWSVAVDADRDVVAAGVIRDASSLNDFAVVKLRGGSGAMSSGWPFTLNGSHASLDDDVAYAVAVGPDDSVIAAGFAINDITNRDMTVVKRRPDGTDFPFCGDGLRNFPTEQCDDGNTTDGDGCSATCQEQAAPDDIVAGVSGTPTSCDSTTTIDAILATSSDPVETRVCVYGAGGVEIHESAIEAREGGFEILGQQVDVLFSPDAQEDENARIALTFLIHESRLPEDVDLSDPSSFESVQVFHDGSLVEDCVDIGPLVPEPNPCVFQIDDFFDNLRVFVYTTVLSPWTVGVPGPTGVPLFVDLATPTSEMVDGEKRETLFQSLVNARLVALSALLDPGAVTDQFRWRIYESNASGSFGSLIFDTTAAYGDLGEATYPRAMSLNVNKGDYYILSLESIQTGANKNRIQLEKEGDQGLPFTTMDGQFVVLDGGANGSFSDTFLPAFGITSEGSPKLVPTLGPVAVLLLGSCLAVIGALSIRRCESNARRSRTTPVAR
jgi:cysteine-rich repeat protein